jgi:hypothetical protein
LQYVVANKCQKTKKIIPNAGIGACVDMMTQIFKQHECKISQLQRELMDLKQKVEFFEEDLGKTKWGVKYSSTDGPDRTNK